MTNEEKLAAIANELESGKRHTVYNADQGWCVTGGLGRIACEQKTDAQRIATALTQAQEVERLRTLIREFVVVCRSPHWDSQRHADEIKDLIKLGEAALEGSKEQGDG